MAPNHIGKTTTWQRLKLVRQNVRPEQGFSKLKLAVKGFFFTPVSPLPLACLRLCVSLILLLQAFAIAPELGELYGDQGVIQRNLGRYMGEQWTPKLIWIYGLMANNPFVTIPFSFNAFVKVMFLVYLLALTGLGLGWHTRLMAFLSWALHFTFMYSNSLANYGLDNFNHIILFYCLWMPVTALSLDQALGRVRSKASSFATLSLRLLQFHLCIVYFIAGFGKAKGAMWWDGEAIWRSIMLPEYRQFDFGWLASAPWLAAIAAWSTLAIEGLYFIFIWPKKTRLFWVYATIGLHIGIAIIQGLHLFGAIMACLTFCAFGLNYEFSKLTVPGKLSLANMQAYRRLMAKVGGTEKKENLWIVFYDSDCGVCDRFVRFILKQDSLHRFFYTPLNGEIAKAVFPESQRKPLTTIALIGPEGLFYRSQAVLKIMQKLGKPWSKLALLNTLPTLVLDGAYRIFASVRRLASLLLRKKCTILSSYEKTRFF